MGKKVVCAGHVCIDITPVIMGKPQDDVSKVLMPGKLINVGEAKSSLGGSVSNTGIGMKVLGGDVTLLGKIGNDEFGNMVYSIYDKYGVAKGLIRQDGEETSYSIVLAIPGIDRIFLHHPGANDTFVKNDIPWDNIKDAVLLHFGYPPLMKKMYDNGPNELISIFEEAHSRGMATSLDFAAIDPKSEAGKVDWKEYLASVLPYVDIFVPSVEELCFMLDKERYSEWVERAGAGDICDILDVNKDIKPLVNMCMSMGCKILMIKCGAPGMYIRTASKQTLDKISDRLELDTEQWQNQDNFERSYKPDRILSGTGAGDTSIAAFLLSIINGEDPQWAMHYATAAGASCITELDAISGLLSFDEMKKKIFNGWEKS